MSTRRLVICMMAVAAISIVNIYHHALTVKHGYELGREQERIGELRVSIATLEGKATMLASPSRLRSENERMQLALSDPGEVRREERAVAAAETRGTFEDGLVRR